MKSWTPVRLDQVHVGVRSRQRAAVRYRRVLRLHVRYDYIAHGGPHGPLVLSGVGNKTHMAPFVDREAAKHRSSHIGTLAFRVTGPDFLRFLGRVAGLKLPGVEGRREGPRDVVEHGNSYSVYVADSDRNPLEIATYDHGVVKRALKG